MFAVCSSKSFEIAGMGLRVGEKKGNEPSAQVAGHLWRPVRPCLDALLGRRLRRDDSWLPSDCVVEPAAAFGRVDSVPTLTLVKTPRPREREGQGQGETGSTKKTRSRRRPESRTEIRMALR